jgi:signal transduction histidine kinase
MKDKFLYFLLNMGIWGKFNIIVALFAISLLCFILTGCEKNAEKQPETLFKYKTFRDIPDVTNEEIQAIEKLGKQVEFFVYGANPATEAFYDETGKIKGFAALFCELLTELFGIQFKPKLYEWDALVAGLESGEIAFSGDLTATDERKKKYLMTDPIALRSIRLFRLAGSPPLSEIAEQRPLRYAFLDGTVTFEEIRKSSKDSFKAIFIDDYNIAYEKLKNNEIDAFIDEGIAEAVFDKYGNVLAKDVFPLLYGEVSLATQTQDFKPIISVVQKMLKNGGSKYLAEMYNEGLRDYMKHKLFMQLSEEERNYIRSHTVIPFAAEHDNYPMSFYNMRENQWQGVVFDALKEVEHLTGLSFNIANDQYAKWTDLLNMLKIGKVPMVSELIRSHDREGQFLWPNHSILTDYYALLSKTDFRDISFNEILYVKVGLVKGTSHAELFHNWFPNHINTVEFENNNSAFEALERNEIDMFMSSQNHLLFLTNFRELAGYKVNILFDLPFKSIFGFHKGDSVLCSIIDKSLTLIDTKSISERWTRRVYDYRVKLAQAQFPLFLGAGILLLCVLILVIILLLRNRNEGKRLEQEVLSRTIELKKSYHDLEKAMKIAEIANRTKTAFLANMSHENKTPLNNVIGFSDRAKIKKNLSPLIKDYLEKISENSKWLLRIINNILDFSQIEFEKMELKNIPFDLYEIFTNCLAAISSKANEKGVVLHIDTEPLVGKNLLGDPAKLTQVFMNLLSNAIKFTNAGTVTLSSFIKHSDEHSCIIRFEVTDNGIGMTAEQIDRIFNPFIQVDSGTTRKYDGAGLGLPVAKNMIEMMGGTLLVESTPRIGSKFMFELSFKTVEGV